MKVADLEGPILDYWVAKAEGIAVQIFPAGHLYAGVSRTDPEYWSNEGLDPYFSPSTDWRQGGTIIERAEIMVCPWAHYGHIDQYDGWYANIFYDGGEEYTTDKCPTPLIAAMRAYVASKFGDELPEVQA